MSTAGPPSSRFPIRRGPPPPRPLPARFRAFATGMLLVDCAVAVAYQLLRAGGMEGTMPFFVGLPLALGLMTIQYTRSATPIGATVQAATIFLIVIAPLLGEGSVCLLMAAPLFLGAAVLVVGLVLVVKRFLFRAPAPPLAHRRDARCVAWIALPVLWGAVERAAEPPPVVPLTVTSVTTVDGSADEWLRLVRSPVDPAAEFAPWPALGFPRPVAYAADAEVATLTFAPRPMPGGLWRLARRVMPDGIDFELLQDTTKIGEWIALRDHRVRVRARTDGRVDVEQATTFVPLLAPHAYFDFLERRAIAAAQRLAIASWQGERSRVAIVAGR